MGKKQDVKEVPIIYPWCYKHQVFNAQELRQIIEYCSTLESNVAKLEGVDKPDNSMRRSTVSWVLQTENAQWFIDRILTAIDALNNQFYKYELWGTHALQFASYDSKILGKYDFHMDSVLGKEKQDMSHARKLSASLLLNDDFVGGSFEFNLSRESHVTPVDMQAGSLIVFPSFLLHRVTPVTSGCRKSLVAWFIGPAFR